MLGLGLSIPQIAVRGTRFSPGSLFAAGEQGAWYDPSDFSTLSQDSAGTTPVTAVEQPVGLMLDKSKGGVGTNGAKRVNLLTKTEEFDDAAWTKRSANAGVTANATTDPLGTSTADEIYSIGAVTDTNVGVLQSLTKTAAAIEYKFSAYVKIKNLNYFSPAISDTGLNGVNCRFNILTGTIEVSPTTFGTGFTAGAATITSVGNGWYFVTLTGTTNTATDLRYIANFTKLANAGSTSYAIGDGGYIWGADLRLASEASTLPTYQRITDTWYNTFAGNHAFQSTPTSRPTLSARVNLLTNTAFTGAVAGSPGTAPTSWSFVLSTGQIVSLNGDELTVSATSQRLVLGQTINYLANSINRMTFVLGQNTGAIAASQIFAWNQAIAGASESFFANGVSQTAATYSPVPGDLLEYRLTIGATAGGSTIRLGIGCAANSTGTVTISKPDLRVANDGVGLPAYQRVDTATSYDTAGFPLYLRFDGSDDSFLTNSVDFSATDKMTVWAGVRKLSDATRGMVAELTGVSPANFNLSAPDVSGSIPVANYGARLSGSLNSHNVYIQTFTSPITNVISVEYSLSGATIGTAYQMRANATNQTEIGTVNAAAGGNFPNAPIYIGRRTNSTLPYNGRIYSLLILGRTASATEIALTENFVNQKTRAF
jgi:hypothetical protein